MHQNHPCAKGRRRHRNSRRKRYLLSLAVVLAFFGSSSVWAIPAPPLPAEEQLPESPPPETQPIETEIPIETEPIETQVPSETEAPLETEQPTPPAEEEPETEAGYDYSMPVPESEMVDESYFDDAIFIGDSRTEGLMMYTNLSNATFYTDKGLTVDTVFTKQLVYIDGGWYSPIDALRHRDFKKVYVMFGINEAGWAYSDIFTENYAKMIDAIKEINPNAIIYIQQIMPVTEHTSQTHRSIKMKKINEYNSILSQIAEEKQVYFIDTGTAVAGDDGYLPYEAASDGIHLKKPYCAIWLDYLKTHTISEIEPATETETIINTEG